MSFDLSQFFSTFIVLFAVIDIFGSLPLILDLKMKGNNIKAFEATLVSSFILLVFFFVGEPLLGLFGVDIASFAIAGAFVLFVIAMEMIIGIKIFRYDTPAGVSIVPIAFPLIAGPGSFTTLLSLRAEYDIVNITIALLINMIIVYIVLKFSSKAQQVIGKAGIYMMQKFFGIILMAMAIRLFSSNFAALLQQFIPGVISK